MKALLARLRRTMGKYTLFIIVIGAIAAGVMLIVRVDGLLKTVLTVLVTMLLVITGMTLTAIARALTKYRFAKATQPYEKVLDSLIKSDAEYCLVLRPFGEDGKITVPSELKKGRVGFAFGFTPNLTMEQVVAAAVQDSLSLRTYAIVDQSVALAPPGLTFMRVADDKWKDVVSKLIRRAHTVVLLLGREQEIGRGFAWEIEQLVGNGVASRVVLTLPPRDDDELSHQRALHQASVLLALLTSTGKLANLEPFRAYEYEMQLPPTTQVACTTETSAVSWWQVKEEPPKQPGGVWSRITKYAGPRIMTDLMYKAAISEALAQTDEQLKGLSFPARYPFRFR